MLANRSKIHDSASSHLIPSVTSDGFVFSYLHFFLIPLSEPRTSMMRRVEGNLFFNNLLNFVICHIYRCVCVGVCVDPSAELKV